MSSTARLKGWPGGEGAFGVAGEGQKEIALDNSADVIYHLVYTTGSSEVFIITAKVFQNGRSQAIRLPKEFRVASDEVYLKKTPEGFLVIEKDPWELFREGVAELSDDFMAAGRHQPPAQDRKRLR